MALPLEKTTAYREEIGDASKVVSDFRVRFIIKECEKMLPSADTKQAAAIYATLGLAYLRLWKNEEALRALLNACKLDPQHSFYCKINAGVALLRLHKPADALALFIEASDMERSPSVFTLINIAEALNELGQHDDAVEVFQEALSVANYGLSADVFALAQEAAEIGLESNAIELFARYLSIKQGRAIGTIPAVEFIRQTPAQYKEVLNSKQVTALAQAVSRAHLFGDSVAKLSGKSPPATRGGPTMEAVEAATAVFDETRPWRSMATSSVLDGDPNA